MFSFEEKIEEINLEISKRKNKWRLNALSYIDFEDVSQILRIHIFNQWSKWDQARPLAQWLNKLISNQIINLIRNNYSKVAPPCNSCAYNMGGNSCSYTPSGERCNDCPLYKAWSKKKKSAYNLKLAVSSDAEDYIEPKSSSSQFGDQIDYDACMEKIHLYMKPKLTSAQWRIYEMLIIKGMADEEVATILKLKTVEEKRGAGYRHFAKMREIFSVFAKQIMEEQDILY